MAALNALAQCRGKCAEDPVNNVAGGTAPRMKSEKERRFGPRCGGWRYSGSEVKDLNYFPRQKPQEFIGRAGRRVAMGGGSLGLRKKPKKRTKG